ncbi:MAG: hypothetical protein Q7R69_01055 [bacterium]|nr:hypothetical protein [bacterium]
MEDEIKRYFEGIDLDIRKQSRGYSRFMDQKVAPDVLSFIADSVVNSMDGKEPGTTFTIGDVWEFPYFVKNTEAVFGKPSPENETTESEYDKFIAQPLKTLAFAKILEEEKVGGKNTYKVLRPDILEYISQSEKNAFIFLVLYIEKVLSDSGFIKNFEEYREKAQSNKLKPEDLEILKKRFQKFILGNTNINGVIEINRVFPKVLNPYAASHQIPGIERGHITSGRFIYPDLMYNRENFRDIGKDKTVSRQEALREITQQPEVVEYRVQKAKSIIRRHHSSSEVKDSLAVGEATQVHHIFSDHEFPEISDYIENLILLTPQQHNTRAHPKNKTNTVDAEYQRECLLSKIDSIEMSVSKRDSLYSKERFIHVVNIGYELDLSTNTSFEELRDIIRKR